MTRIASIARHSWLLLLAVPLMLLLQSRGSAEHVLFNARVLTLDAGKPFATAVLIRDGRIAATGTDDEVLEQASSAAQMRDMDGRSIVPGFVDAHSHFPVSGVMSVSVNVAPPPLGPGSSKAAVLQAISDAIPQEPAKGGAPLILGFNYDDTAFDVPQHPTRDELDAISRGYPVYLWHSSGHLGVGNTAALERLGIPANGPAIDGGERVRDAGGRLTGLLIEKAAPPLASLIAELSWRDRWNIVTHARDEYLAAGVTVVQNGHAAPLLRRVLNGLHTLGVVPQTVHTWVAHHTIGDSDQAMAPAQTPIKIIVDGSPQGLTAYLGKPYEVPAFGPFNAGLKLYEQDALNALVLHYHEAGHQLALHGNGDAAIDQIIIAVEAAQAIAPRADARHILVHAQTLRADQIARLMDADLTPSFFIAHTYYWGDRHRQTLGEERAARISPAGSAERAGLRYTLHADTPVTPIDPLFLMWAATERTTRSGVVLGESERIDREAALRAVTLDAAWQSFMDDERGSLSVGKRADIVVLSEDPLDVGDLRDVRVDETWIDGRRRYRR